MKSIKDANLNNKKVILRCDFNVPIEDGKILDKTKIISSIPTINYLIENNCRICILSHLNRIESEEDKKNNSLAIVAEELSKEINKDVIFLNKCFGDEVKQTLDNYKSNEIIMLENTRFMDYPLKKESNNDLELAKFWASLGEIFVFDAFATSHRLHASTKGIASILPTYMGLLVEKEINNLDVLINDEDHPFTVFMGGAKVEDKLPIITELLKRCDYLMLGGGIANSFLKATGMDIGNSIATSSDEIINELSKLMIEYKEKIILPIDFIKDNNSIYDIGLESINLFKEYIDKSKVIFVNGTPGKYEEDLYSEGTKNLFKVLKESNSEVIVGGGDTVAALNKFGYENDFSYVSTGGGATLEYIAYKKMKAIDE